MLRPSAAEWSQFEAGTRPWEDISWAQSVHGSRTGLRQTWCRIELQLRPSHLASDDADLAIPFFGSATAYYEMRKP